MTPMNIDDKFPVHDLKLNCFVVATAILQKRNLFENCERSVSLFLHAN